jgi:hypothetical protein
MVARQRLLGEGKMTSKLGKILLAGYVLLILSYAAIFVRGYWSADMLRYCKADSVKLSVVRRTLEVNRGRLIYQTSVLQCDTADGWKFVIRVGPPFGVSFAREDTFENRLPNTFGMLIDRTTRVYTHPLIDFTRQPSVQLGSISVSGGIISVGLWQLGVLLAIPVTCVLGWLFVRKFARRKPPWPGFPVQSGDA